MSQTMQNKRFRGTGLYRNHSRRRGDKEHRIKILLHAAETQWNEAQDPNAEKASARQSAERALGLYYDLLDSIHNFASGTQEETEAGQLLSMIKEKIQKIEDWLQH